MIYIDNVSIPYKGMYMSHMVADNLDELHTFALSIGLKRNWFQSGRHPHYDVCLSKKMYALRNGAKETTSKELLSICKRLGE